MFPPGNPGGGHGGGEGEERGEEREEIVEASLFHHQGASRKSHGGLQGCSFPGILFPGILFPGHGRI